MVQLFSMNINLFFVDVASTGIKSRRLLRQTRLYSRSLVLVSTFGFIANLPAWCAKKDITGVIANRPDLAISLKATSTSTNSTKLNHAGFAIREKITFWRNFSDSLSQLHLRMLMSSSSSKARARKKRERELWVPQTHLNLSQCQLFLSIWIIFVFSPRLVESNESFNLKLSSRIA